MNVKILQVKQQTALVEWADAFGTHRAYVPLHELNERSQNSNADTANVFYETLHAGIPYGEPWELYPLGQVGPETIATALRNRGIWTLLDVRTRVQDVKAALQEAYSADLKQLLDSARPTE